MPEVILVSACLLGLNTRYSGKTKLNPQVVERLRQEGLTPVPVCPEQLAGLPTPRPPAEYACGDGLAVLKSQGRIVNRDGADLSATFLRGAEQTLKIAELTGCRAAVLKERSPSCGVRQIYRRGRLEAGSGVTAALLCRNGLTILSEEDLEAGSPF